MRHAVPAQLATRSVTQTLPAPVRGWIENENLARNGGQGCSVCENFFPLQATVRVRGGHLLSATIGDPVLSLISYRSTTGKLFAASADAVYDVSGLDDDTVPAAAISGLTAGRWSSVQMTTAGGVFLFMVNGADDAQLYDGASWTAINTGSSPAVTGVATADLSHVWMHGGRIWAVEKDTQSAWYLDPAAIGGAANEFPLNGVFRRGGVLLFGDTWSGDSGDGMDDRQVFVSDQGEVAVYEGTDPSDPDAWALVGRYDIGRPVGTTTIKAGGDLLISTVDGIVPISAVVTKDPAALSLAAITLAIEPSWRRAVRLSANEPFQLFKWQRETMLLVGMPNDPLVMFVANLQSGAWAKWTGMSATCFGLYDDLAYFGTEAGDIFLAEGSGADDGLPYVSRLSMLPDPLGAPGAYKTPKQARATFRALAPFTPRLSVASDYRTEFPAAPNAAADTSAPALWDVGTWDVSKWDDGPDSAVRQTRSTLWKSVVNPGFAIAPQVQVTTASTRKPDAELVAFDLSYEVGGTVV